ncbi:MAG: hypothetical protein ACW968_07605 [Candidatus Thorarchaeota archaeon]
MPKETSRWYMSEETKSDFLVFKREYETEMKLPKNLSQGEFVALLNKHKVQILDVIVNAEIALDAEEGKVPA